MFNLTILCIVLAGITAIFWVSEWPKTQGLNFIQKFVSFKYLVADIIFTILIVKVFSLGGLIGTCMGFMISNVISGALMLDRLKQRKPV